MKIPIAILTLASFFISLCLGPMPLAQADGIYPISYSASGEFHLPAAGVMVHLSPKFDPPILKGVKVHPDNPFHFDFILDQGDSQPGDMASAVSPSSLPSKRGLNVKAPQRQNPDALKAEATRLIKYFLASLTIPEKDLWVNLSPYEKDRIVPQSFGLTEMGRDLLAEDYMLKQITASLIYPEDEIGKKFWKRIYEEAEKKFGTTNIPVNTFNKVWIVPEKAVVYENAKMGAAYVVESKLKIMLEQDYLSLSKHEGEGIQSSQIQVKNSNQLGSQIIREIVIPELSREVNENKNFTQLRQVYNSFILATWYKKKIKDSILKQVYADKNKVAGIHIDNPEEKEKIYQRYLQAFKKGVYNYIKEETISIPGMPRREQGILARKYFSGGMNLTDFAQLVLRTTTTIDRNALNEVDHLFQVSTGINVWKDQAMAGNNQENVTSNPLDEVNRIISMGYWPAGQGPILLNGWVGKNGVEFGKFPFTELFSGFKLRGGSIGTGGNLDNFYLIGMEWENGEVNKVYFKGERTIKKGKEKGQKEEIPVTWVRKDQIWLQEELEIQKIQEIVQSGQWPEGQGPVLLNGWIGKSGRGEGQFPYTELFSGFKPGKISIGTGGNLDDFFLTGMEWENGGVNKVHFKGECTIKKGKEKGQKEEFPVTWVRKGKVWQLELSHEELEIIKIQKIAKSGKWPEDQESILLNGWVGKNGLHYGVFPKTELFPGFRPGRVAIGIVQDLDDFSLIGMEWENGEVNKVHFKGERTIKKGKEEGQKEEFPVTWVRKGKVWQLELSHEELEIIKIQKIAKSGKWPEDQESILLNGWVGKNGLEFGKFPYPELFSGFKPGKIPMGTGQNLDDFYLTGMEWENGEVNKVHFKGERTIKKWKEKGQKEEILVTWVKKDQIWLQEELEIQRIQEIAKSGQWPEDQRPILLNGWCGKKALHSGLFPETELFVGFKPGRVSIGTGGDLDNFYLIGMEWKDGKVVKLYFKGIKKNRKEREVSWIWSEDGAWILNKEETREMKTKQKVTETFKTLVNNMDKDTVLRLSTRYGRNMTEILWRVAALKLQGQYDKEHLRRLFNQKLTTDVLSEVENAGGAVNARGEIQAKALKALDRREIQQVGDNLQGLLDEVSQDLQADPELVKEFKEQGVLLLRKMEEVRFFKEFYSKAVGSTVVEKTRRAMDDLLSESQDNKLIQDASLELLVEVQDCLKLIARLQAHGLVKDIELNLYQLIAVKKMWEGKRKILADEMGLGKTLQAIATFLLSEKKEMLVLGPNQVLSRWVEDLYNHTDTTIELVILSDSLKVPQGLKNDNITVVRPKTAEERNQYLLDKKAPREGTRRVIVMNYEALPSFEKHRSARRAEGELPQIKTGFLVLDEAHWLKNTGSQRSKTVFGDGKRCKPIDAEFKLLLTGTPLENGIRDFLGALQFMAQGSSDGEDRFMLELSPQRFGQLYRLDNLEKLARLYGYVENHMIRRLKEDMDVGLPPKKYVQVSLDTKKRVARLSTGEEIPLTGNYTKLDEVYEMVSRTPLEFEREYVDPLGDQEAQEDTPEASLTQLMRMGQVSTDLGIFPALAKYDSIKLDVAKALIQKRLAQGERHIVVFTEYAPVVGHLKDMLEQDDFLKGKVVAIEGDIDLEERTESIKRFQSGEAIVLIATRPSGGLGVNLTRGDIIINMNRSWKPSDEDQKFGRVDRIDNQGRHYEGKEIEILELEYEAEVPIDEIKRKVIQKKQIITEMMLNGNFSQEVLDAFRNIDDSVFEQVEEGMKETQDLVPDEYEASLMQQYIFRIHQINQTGDEVLRREMWDNLAELYVTILERKGSFFANMALLDWLSKEHQGDIVSDITHPMPVLDLAAGPSMLYRAYERIREELSARGVFLDIFEIEASVQMIARGVHREGRQYLGDIEAIDSLGENKFGRVNLSYAYRFVKHPARFMYNVHRLLQNNGLLTIILPESETIPARFTEALSRLGFEVIVGEGGHLESKLDDKTHGQLMLKYGQEFANDLARYANGRFTLLVARKEERAVDFEEAKVSDDDLRLLRQLPVDKDKLERMGHMIQAKHEELEILVHGGKAEGDVIVDRAGEGFERQDRNVKTAKFVERVGEHLSNLLGIIHSEVDSQSMGERKRSRNYQQVKKGLERLLERLTEMKDAEDFNEENVSRMKEKIESFKGDKKVGQWFRGGGGNLNDVIRRMEAVLDDKAMMGDGTVNSVSGLDKKGGIDFTVNKTPLEIRNSGEEIKFKIDAAMLQRLQNAPGFVPVIISIQPMLNLKEFLGVN